VNAATVCARQRQNAHYETLLQAQPAISRATKVSAPQRIATGKVSALFDFGFIVSSIGSPQTDRGPPLS